MGGGGQMSDCDYLNEFHRRNPHSPLVSRELKKTIPPHCFRRSVLRSFSYVVYDLTIASIFYYIATTYFQNLPSLLYYPAWPLYWVAQGSVLTGVWIITHECGHHAFSDYQWLDDTVGIILHSPLMVPYFSWKYSHRKHHSNVGSLERDEVFLPQKRSSAIWYFKYFNNPPGRVLCIAVRVLLGWPLYLAYNERLQLFTSDAGLLYGVPLLVVNGFLIISHTFSTLSRRWTAIMAS